MSTEPPVRYVVDASVLVQNFITDTYTASVDSLFAQASREIVELWVPEFCLAECANVLWKAVRFRGMSPQQAETLIRDLTAAPLYIATIAPYLPRALAIGLRHQLPIYDSVYIAIAEAISHPLITVDRRQAEVASAESVPLKAITDFPPA